MSYVEPRGPHVIADRRILIREDPAQPNAILLAEDIAPHELPARLVELAQDAAGCRVALYVADLGGSELRIVAGAADWPAVLPLPQSLGPELTRGRMGDLQRLVGERLEGATAVPLWLHGRAVAVVVCEERPRQELEPLARQAAAAIEIADRYTDVFHRGRRRQSTTPAAELQENLLPPRYAALEDAELAAGLVPAYEVGGDWYDYAQNPEGAWLAVADAAGKGPAAAGSSSVALGALRAARRGGLGMPEAARAIDTAIRQLPEAAFVTAVVAQWHPATRTFSWLRFGHPYPLLLDARGRVAELTASSHLPLGLLGDHADLEPSHMTLNEGDRVVITSDGVTERRTTAGGFFGAEALQRVLREVAESGAVPVATSLIESVIAASAETPHDDATVLVLAA